MALRTCPTSTPGLVVVSLSNFGRKGPYRDYKASELILSGLSGPMYISGTLDREPVKGGGRIVQFQAGLVAGLLTMTAIRSRDRSGAGSHVDLSTMETQSGTADRWVPVLLLHSYTGSIAERTRGVVLAGAGVVPTLDGYINTLNPTTASRLKRVLTMVGKPELLDSPEFADPIQRLAMANEEFLLWALQHSTDEAVYAGLRHGVMVAPVHTHESLHKDSHMLVRRPWIEVEHLRWEYSLFLQGRRNCPVLQCKYQGPRPGWGSTIGTFTAGSWAIQAWI